MKRLVALCLACAIALPAIAQNYTTAAEVKPILSITKPQWITVRTYDGHDLLYFSNLLAWRCGLSEIRYGVNGGPMTVFASEPCYEDEAQPNALKAETLDRLLVSLAPKSVETVVVEVTYDDGTTDRAVYDRAAIENN